MPASSSTVARISPTQMTRWFSLGCPAAYRFGQQYDYLKPNIHLAVGTLVHGILEGQSYAHGSEAAPFGWDEAVKIAKKLSALKTALGLTVLFDDNRLPLVELKQVWRIAKGIDFVRIIDFIARTADGELIIGDWKSTLGNGWKSKPLTPLLSAVPQAEGFQSIGYLVPPPKRLLKGLSEVTGWPTTMWYLVGPIRMQPQVFRYAWKEEDHADFKAALQLIAASEQTHHHPKVKGKHCLECDFFGPCYKPQGWEALYHRRGKDDHRAAKANPD